jgi:hypothetical protein
MGAFFLKGFDQHLQDGMPFPFQNGLICGMFFHLYANDHEGPLGDMIRAPFAYIQPLSMNDSTFATFLVSAFMVITGLLQLPELLGPSFNPFDVVSVLVPQKVPSNSMSSPTKQSPGAPGSEVDSDDGEDLDENNVKGTLSKKKRQKKKKKA